ncbi:MAG: glycoside hydrolase family 127 protein [Bacteroidales bacterium]|nr:glycoside hydrolase family 127 protein [Bacteroidales bacterium]
MKKILFPLLALLACTALNAQDKLYADEFPLGDITLLDGPLKHARDLNVQTLLQYDCDRLLAPYRKEAGLEPKAPTYPNWDGLDGHIAGHYLTAMAINAATGDAECRRRMEYMLSELQLVADTNTREHPDWGLDYVGGFPGSAALWTDFKAGEFRRYFAAWAPFYNLHKMFAGLRDAWVYCGNEQAKALFLRFCDWAVWITAGLSDEQMEQMLRNEHGGMNEVLADAYAVSGDRKYLDCARRFSHKLLLDAMRDHDDILDNMHANTQVPKAVGFTRIAELDGDAGYLEAGRWFWENVTGSRSLAFGGNSRREHFPSKDACIDFVRDIDGPESCNTYNMLKLTEDLHRLEPQARYAEFYERALFNHILSTQHPEHGGYVYFTSARPRHYRNYSAPNEAMWCCVGTGMENHGKYGQFIYTHTGNDLYVNLFAASELNWREKGVTLRQETDFPYGENAALTVAEGRGRFALQLRKPSWVKDGAYEVRVNGRLKRRASKAPDGYVRIARRWKKGDVVEVRFPMADRVEHLPNVPQYVALMHGPVLLGQKTGTEDLKDLIADDSRFGQYASGTKLPLAEAPFIVADDIDAIADGLEPVPGEPLHFRLTADVHNPVEGELQPFFEIHDARYMMYWLAMTPDAYASYLEETAREEAELAALDARTLDKVQPGEQQPETDHRMETDGSMTGNDNDVFYRDARNGRSFSYLMRTGGRTGLSVFLKYWGVGEWKTREFDIYVDNKLLQSVNNTGRWNTSAFVSEEFPIPDEMLRGRQSVRVKFVAHPGKQTGGIYEVRLVDTKI